MEQKSLAEMIKNGLKDEILPKVVLGVSSNISTADSTYAKQIEINDAQQSLLTRQEVAFDDVQLQKVFDTQIKYASMIFQDDPDPNVLEIGKDTHVANIYNAMLNRVNSVDDELMPNVPHIKGCELPIAYEDDGTTPSDCQPCGPDDSNCPTGSNDDLPAV